MTYVHPTILVIDDDVLLRGAMEELLGREGYRVETAGDGREALNKLHRGLRPCVIMMDLMMPVMTGFEFRQEQMQYPEFCDIPIIVYSGITNLQENARHLDAAAYAEKATDPARVMALVRQHCLK